MTCADHNILFLPFFAPDEAQTLDAVYRNDQSAIQGMSDALSECLSAAGGIRKTGKELNWLGWLNESRCAVVFGGIERCIPGLF